jgi:hypothetical protein
MAVEKCQIHLENPIGYISASFRLNNHDLRLSGTLFRTWFFAPSTLTTAELSHIVVHDFKKRA